MDADRLVPLLDHSQFLNPRLARQKSSYIETIAAGSIGGRPHQGDL